MDIKYVSRTPARLRKDGRLPQSERAGQLPGHGKLIHATAVDITPRHVVAKNQAAREKRINDMFSNMQAVEVVPSARRGRASRDYSQDKDFQALKSMPVMPDDSEQEKVTGWSGVEAGSVDKAKKLQAQVNVYARAGAGTFKTRLPKGSTMLYIKRIAEEYVPQRGKGSDE